MESEAVQMVHAKYSVVIWSEDTFNPNYLIKSLTKSSEITDEFCDDYGHTFPVGHSVGKEHYLDVRRSKNVILL